LRIERGTQNQETESDQKTHHYNPIETPAGPFNRVGELLKATKSPAIFDHEMLLATKSVRRSGETCRRWGGMYGRVGVSAGKRSAAFGVQRCSLVSAKSSSRPVQLSTATAVLNAER
jgi:hypothetical protein